MCNFVAKITKLSIYKYNDMAYTILTATEAAAMIKNNENIALSGRP